MSKRTIEMWFAHTEHRVAVSYLEKGLEVKIV